MKIHGHYITRHASRQEIESSSVPGYCSSTLLECIQSLEIWRDKLFDKICWDVFLQENLHFLNIVALKVCLQTMLAQYKLVRTTEAKRFLNFGSLTRSHWKVFEDICPSNLIIISVQTDSAIAPSSIKKSRL